MINSTRLVNNEYLTHDNLEKFLNQRHLPNSLGFNSYQYLALDMHTKGTNKDILCHNSGGYRSLVLYSYRTGRLRKLLHEDRYLVVPYTDVIIAQRIQLRDQNRNYIDNRQGVNLDVLHKLYGSTDKLRIDGSL